MGNLFVVTNRALCPDDFLVRIAAIASARPDGILLREKALDEAAYGALAEQCLRVCKTYGVPLVAHTYASVAVRLGLPLHVPLMQLRQLHTAGVRVAGVSVHSAAEAQEAEQLGAAYVTAGHVFATACKPGLPPRGVAYVAEVCSRVTIPVFSIGGITEERIPAVLQAGAAGVCVMSGLMTCSEPAQETARLREAVRQDH